MVTVLAVPVDPATPNLEKCQGEHRSMILLRMWHAIWRWPESWPKWEGWES